MGDAPRLFPLLQDHPAPLENLAGTGLLPHRLGSTGRTLRAPARHQLGQGPPRRLQEAVKKGGEDTGPSPVGRSKCGAAIHLATDEYGIPLGATVTKAGANDGVRTQDVLEAMVIQPPAAEVPVEEPDRRDLPHARADGRAATSRPRSAPSGRGSGCRRPSGARPGSRGSAASAA